MWAKVERMDRGSGKLTTAKKSPAWDGEDRLRRDLREINWRLPTLAEPIEPLPLARVCLTAEFGMGSGRATPLWPPKIGCQKIGCRGL